MTYKQTITDRVKFVIRYLISQGFATSQEDLGKKLGVSSKSYLSQLVSAKQNNTDFIKEKVATSQLKGGIDFSKILQIGKATDNFE